MFQKALKSKNKPHREAISHDEKLNKTKKFKDKDENHPKPNRTKLKTPNPSNTKEPLTLIETHKSRTSGGRDQLKQTPNDKLVRKSHSRSNQGNRCRKTLPKLKEVKSLPQLIPPSPSRTDFALNDLVALNRTFKDSEIKIKPQSKTSFKLPAEEVERLSNIYPRPRKVEVKGQSEDSHKEIRPGSKTCFKLSEEEANGSYPKSLLPIEEIRLKSNGLSFMLPTEDPQTSYNPTEKDHAERSSSIAVKSLTTRKELKEFKSQVVKKTSETYFKHHSVSDIDKGSHQLSKTTSGISLRSFRRSITTEIPFHVHSRQTLRNSASTASVRKFSRDQRKSGSQLRQRVAKTISTDGLRKSVGKFKRKSKKGKLKESDKIPYSPDATVSSYFQSHISTEDDSNLPEELKLMRFVKKVRILVKVLKQLRQSQEKRLVSETSDFSFLDDIVLMESTLNVQPKSLEQQEPSHFRVIVAGNIPSIPKKQPTELLKGYNTLSRYIQKRSNPYSEDGVNPMAKRFKTLLAEVSSGSSSEGYIEWKSQLWQEYHEAKYDNEATETESSSSLNENIQNVSTLNMTTSVDNIKPDSISVPESPQIDMNIFSMRQEFTYRRTLKQLDDLGKFVDPITGEVLVTPPTSMASSSLELSTTTGDEDREGEEASKAIVMLEKSVVNLEDSDLDESLFNGWDERYDTIQDETISEEHKMLALFMEQSQTLKLKKPDKITLKLHLQKPPTFKENLPQIVYEFVDSLVHWCVINVEKSNSLESLRKSLCKRKLLRELHILLGDRDIERKFNDRLNHHVYEYLRRRKKLPLIIENGPQKKSVIDKGTDYRERYYHASENLDNLLMRMEEAQEFCKQKVKEESELCAIWMERSSKAIEDLEQYIRTSVVRDQQQEKLAQSIDRQLHKMAKVRREISEERYKLVTLQHLHCKLTQGTSNIQEIGNGLQISNFESLYSEIQGLIKQNQEQEAQNERVRRRCSSYIEQVAHIREQNSIMRNSNQVRRYVLDDLCATIHWQREKICAMKSQHNEIRQMISDLKWRGGIMDKPLLMLDYDETIKRIQGLRGEIESWKHQSSILEPQIKAVEEKCFRVAHK